MIVYEFDENMIIICLLANGWVDGWKNQMWKHQDYYGEYTTKEAFERLLYKSNMFGKSFADKWQYR